MVEELERLQRMHASGTLTDDEFAAAKARLIEKPREPALRQLKRINQGAWLAGVCAGLGRFSGVSPFVWRAGFLLFVPAAGISVVLYTLMAFFTPLES